MTVLSSDIKMSQVRALRRLFVACKHACTHAHTHTHTHTHNHFTAHWILSGTTWVIQYQKKHSPTHTYRGHQSSLKCFLHLLRSMASSVFNLCAWQSFSRIHLQFFFGLPLWTLSKSFFQIHKAKIELLSFRSKLLLHLSYNKNGVNGSFTLHKPKLHITCINLLLNSVFEDPFHHFHSMFQQFNSSVRSTSTSPDQPGSLCLFIFLMLQQLLLKKHNQWHYPKG